MISSMDTYLDDIRLCVKNFNVNESEYCIFKPGELGIKGDESNTIFLQDDNLPEGYTITLGPKAKNCTIFIERNAGGKNFKLTLKGVGNCVYISSETSLNGVNLAVSNNGDFAVIGKGVTVTAQSLWSIGTNPGMKNNGLIIGDHCMMSAEIVIRPADCHPIIDMITGLQINKTKAPVVIEPYCWISQRGSILKNVRIGACSIISYGAVVTKSCERFSVLSGVPAKSSSIKGKLWRRGEDKRSIEIYEMYKERYSPKMSGSAQNKEKV